MNTLGDTWYFRRYDRARARKRFSRPREKVIHALGIARIVYDWQRGDGRELFNGYNPLSWLILVLLVLTIGVWEVGLGNIFEELDDDWAWRLYERDDNGAPRFVSLRRAFPKAIDPHNPDSA